MSSPSTPYVYLTIGTTDTEGLHLIKFTYEDSNFDLLQQVKHQKRPSFQAFDSKRDILYSVSDINRHGQKRSGSVAAYKFENEQLRLLNIVSSGGNGTCHISLHPSGRWIYVSNYGSGSLTVFEILYEDGVGEKIQKVQFKGSSIHPERQTGPHTHSANPSPDGRFLYVADLGADTIHIFSIDENTGSLSQTGQTQSTPGSGPRHSIILDGSVYVVEELASMVSFYERDPYTGDLKLRQRLSTLDELSATESLAAEIKHSADGSNIYVSNRGDDSITTFKRSLKTGELHLIAINLVEGSHPRHFCLDSTGKNLFVANRDSTMVRRFHRNPHSGLLKRTIDNFWVFEPVCITVLP